MPSQSNSSQVIFESPISDVSGTVLDISAVAEPCHFRFLDCRAFVDDEILRLVTMVDVDLSTVAYSATSYPWKGNPPLNADASDSQDTKYAGSFSVKGAEDGDAISLMVLRCACIASLSCDGSTDSVGARPNPKLCTAPYLWIDRLCIMQTSKQDKSWQIRHMFSLYRNCTQCLVLPGGLQRLVHLDEETSWAKRAWTLQEALAPRASFVIFAWEWRTGFVSEEKNQPRIKLRCVLQGVCALTHLAMLINSCIAGRLCFWYAKKNRRHGNVLPFKRTKRRWIVPAMILGGPKAPTLFALSSAYGCVGTTQDRGIWQSAFCRTSSRPVDMVFSIMGLFSVELDPQAFDVNDRIGATVALAQAILRKGGSADWLGIATRARPCEQISSFPDFPQTTVDGPGKLLASSGELVLSETIVDVDNLSISDSDSDSDMSWDDSDEEEWDDPVKMVPKTSMRSKGREMDDDGYLHIDGIVCMVTPVTTYDESTREEGHYGRTVDGNLWEFLDGVRAVTVEDVDFPRNIAVFIGKFTPTYDYLDISDSSEDEIGDPGSTSSSSSDSSSGSSSDLHDTCKFMLATEHAPERFHAASYFTMDDRRGIWSKRVRAWGRYTVSVGGPKPIQ